MINLLPPEYLAGQQTDWKKIIAISLIIVIFLVVGFTSLRLVLNNRELENKLEITENKLNELRSELRELPALESEKGELESRLKNRATIIDRQINWLAMLSQLELIMPGRAWIEEFRIAGDRNFNLTGYVLRTQIRDLIEKLESSPYFNNLTLNYTEQRNISYVDYEEEKATFFRLSGTIAGNQGER